MILRPIDPYAPTWKPQRSRAVEPDASPARDLVNLAGDPERLADFRKTLAQVDLDVAVRGNHQNLNAALGGPLVVALLTALRASSGPARAELRAFLEENQGNTSGDGFKPGHPVLDGNSPFTVAGLQVIVTPSETRPIESLGPELWNIAAQVRNAGRKELLPFAAELAHLGEHFKPNDTVLSVQQALLHALPELATPEYLARELAPNEKALPTIGAFYGPSVMLDHYLAAPKSDVLAARELRGYVADAGFIPSPEQTSRLARRVDREAIELLDALYLQNPAHVTLEQRKTLQAALLDAPQDITNLALWDGPVGRLAAGDRALVPSLLERVAEPRAQALLLSAPLTDEEFAALEIKPPLDFAYKMASLARSLRGATFEQAAEKLAEIKDEKLRKSAGNLVFAHARAQGEYPELERLKDWQTEPALPYLLRRGPEAMPEMEAALNRLKPGRLCYDQLFGKLVALTAPNATLTKLVDRFLELTPSGNWRDETLAETGLRLFGQGDDEEFANGRATLEKLRTTWSEDDLHQGFNALAKQTGLRSDWGFRLYGRLAEGSAGPDQAMAAFKALEGPGEAGLERFQAVRACRPGQATEVFASAWAYRGDDWDGAVAGLERVARLTSDETYVGAAEQYFEQLGQGTSVDSAIEKVVRHQLAGAREVAPSGVAEHGQMLLVGGAAVRKRTLR